MNAEGQKKTLQGNVLILNEKETKIYIDERISLSFILYLLIDIKS